ncbi:ABC transporter permease [Roseobacter sp.]|uniref:ABC transporter permease n=1 Tax=Roseobacter sp. TaxID=1907202 RepID=UPI00385E00BD
MTLFLVQRLLQGVVIIFVMSLIVFMGVYAIGNPVEILINPDATPEIKQQAIEKLGLDKPFHEQYGYFLIRALQGDLGNSFIYDEPALKLILAAMPATLELAISSLVLAMVFGIPLGMVAGYWPEAWFSKLILSASILGFSLPSFWVGLMLIVLFAVHWGVLPSGGRGDTVSLFGVEVSFLTWDGLKHLFLPALNLALFKIALVIRLTRAGMRETLQQDYIKFAYAKGLSVPRVVFVHAFRNILIPIVTVLGLELGTVIAFAVVTETIFSWPGMGKLIIDSINLLDRPIVVAYLMLTVLMFVIINLLVDLTYSFIDPRVRLTETDE